MQAAGLNGSWVEIACKEVRKPHLRVVLAEATKPGRATDQAQRMRAASKDMEHPIKKLLRERILIIDGAMGTTIRTYNMKETDKVERWLAPNLNYDP